MGLESGLMANLASSIGGASSQYYATRAQGRIQSNALELNAMRAEMEAQDALRRGQIESSRQLGATQRLIGSQRAAMAAQGIQIDSGSASEVVQDTAALGALDALTIRNNAYREAYGYRSQGAGYLGQARLTRMGARAAGRSTLLTGGLSVARDLTSYRDRYIQQKQAAAILKRGY
jgi:hypothetical protein